MRVLLHLSLSLSLFLSTKAKGPGFSYRDVSGLDAVSWSMVSRVVKDWIRAHCKVYTDFILHSPTQARKVH